MKTARGTESRKSRVGNYARLFPGLLAIVALWAVSAPGRDSASGTSTKNASDPPDASAATNQPASAGASVDVSAILKLADAGVSTEVMKTYAESSSTAPRLTDEGIIALKKHNVPDEVTLLLLKRGTEARTTAARNRQDAVLQLVTTRRMASGGFDRESYDYFQYYYLQPRAMASAYQRLAPYHYPYYSRPYGYGPAYGFGRPFSGRPVSPGGPFLP